MRPNRVEQREIALLDSLCMLKNYTLHVTCAVALSSSNRCGGRSDEE
ncbi:MAG: hypothetical protein NDJ92_14970 [Thermoanaerobaculia bacterium]|nr:hypothetical protein [Thermoanaerobaculia bacterium]